MRLEINRRRWWWLGRSRYALTCFAFKKHINIIETQGREGASPDLRRGLTGAEPGIAEEREGRTEKSETWSVSLISLRTLLAR